MNNNNPWVVPEQTLYVISTLPVEQQRDFYKEKYETAMTLLRQFMEDEITEKLITIHP